MLCFLNGWGDSNYVFEVLSYTSLFPVDVHISVSG